MVRIRRWVVGKRKKVIWSEPKLPPFVKIAGSFCHKLTLSGFNTHRLPVRSTGVTPQPRYYQSFGLRQRKAVWSLLL